MTRAVKGIITKRVRKGTNTMWTADGMSFWKPLYTSAATAAMISGTNTLPPYSGSSIGAPKTVTRATSLPSSAFCDTIASGCSASPVNSGVNSANMTAAGTQPSIRSFLPAL